MKNLSAYELSVYGANVYQSSAYGPLSSAVLGGPFGGHATLANGLLAVWEFDGAVTTAPDPDYYGNPTFGSYTWSTANGGPATAISIPSASKHGASAYLKNTSGDQSFELVTNDFRLDVISDITVSAWTKRTNRGVNVFACQVAGTYSPSTTDYAFQCENHPKFFVTDSLGEVLPSTATGSTGTAAEYNLQVGGFDSSVQRSFASCNGEAKIMAVGDALVNGPLLGGDRVVTGLKHLSGTPIIWVDALMVWNRVLTDQEIADLYAAGDGLFY